MSIRVTRFELQVDDGLAAFVESSALAGTGVAADDFWRGLSSLVHELGPQNRALLAMRQDLQDQIDAWHLAHRGQ
ncbi:MAG: malate synthase G, partial [Alphaproteobacteria bacterium]